MYIRVSLRGMLRLIRVDTLRRVHNVGFLAGRLNLLIHIFQVRTYFVYEVLLAVCLYDDKMSTALHTVILKTMHVVVY